MPDVQIYENATHMVQRVRAQLAQTKAEARGLRDIIEEVIGALPQIGGEAGAAIAEEIRKALPPSVNAMDPSPHGGYAALPAPTVADVQPHLQLSGPSSSGPPARPMRALPAQGQTGEQAVIGPIPEGFPLDAIPPEFRQQAARQNGQAIAPPAPQAAPQGQSQRFGTPRQQPQQRAQQQPNGGMNGGHPGVIDVPYQQPGAPTATIQRNVGITDVISQGSNERGQRVVVGRLTGSGQPAPTQAPAQRPPGKLSGIQAAIAKARAGGSGG